MGANTGEQREQREGGGGREDSREGDKLEHSI